MYTQTAVVMLGYRTAYDGHAASLWILDSDHHGRAQPAGPDTVVQDGGAWRQCGESGVRRTRFLRDERILVASLLASLPSSHKISIVFHLKDVSRGSAGRIGRTARISAS
jgi:hypothetical protein